jgi:cobalt-zinc-cadmium efflux system protein
LDSHHGHHDHTQGADEKALLMAFGLTAGFLFVELAAGVLTRSLALISDAAHMFTDAAALGIAMAAVRLARRAADAKRTFGYHRFEILAAAFNAMLLFGIAVYIGFEAWLRFQNPPSVGSTGMLVVAVIGMLVNLAGMRLLAAGKDGSLNMKGAYLEAWSDMLGSLGVIVGAVVIKFTGWDWVDSLVAVLIALWVVPRTWALFRASVNILLEGVPEEIELAEVRAALLAVPGVRSVHDLHVWALTSGKVSLTAHLVNDAGINAATAIVPQVREHLARRFGIRHITVQCELEPCAQSAQDECFGPQHAAPGGASHRGHSH